MKPNFKSTKETKIICPVKLKKCSEILNGPLLSDDEQFKTLTENGITIAEWRWFFTKHGLASLLGLF